MEGSSVILGKLSGELKYVQFISSLENFVESEILSEGWQNSANAFGNIMKKKKYHPSLKKAIHNAILGAFNKNLNEMFTSVDLQKDWNRLTQESIVDKDRNESKSYSPSQASLRNLKSEHKRSLESIIELKLQSIEEIKQSIFASKLAVSAKMSELKTSQIFLEKNFVLLREMDAIDL